MKPLAERMRPSDLNDYFGQQHLVGEAGVIRNALANRQLPSMIFWGPPGVGKTTLAEIIARISEASFQRLSAIESGVKDIRKAIEKATNSPFFNSKQNILFIDEIHRFNKSQQDALLGAVEKGLVTLIGATTENPSFEVNSALLSRCQVYTLKHLEKAELIALAKNALNNDEILKSKPIDFQEWDALIAYSSGDARKLLNLIEIIHQQMDADAKVNNATVEKLIKSSQLIYDKDGEYHYDVISAFIKSIRGSDPNATLYWLALMIEAGEDPKFICRRMIILAAEDIGLANPNALLLANACMEAIKTIGMPEGRIVMSQTAIYLATSEKSNSAYLAIDEALNFVRKQGQVNVPLHLRNAPTKLMKSLNYGTEYKYPHDYPSHFAIQDYLPEELKNTTFYKPAKNKMENRLQEWLEKRWKDKYDF